MRVPVYTGHSLAITAASTTQFTKERAEEILNQSSGVELDAIPTPLKTAGIDSTYVGRIRPDSVFEKWFELVSIRDNLRKGAALNAVQIAEALI